MGHTAFLITARRLAPGVVAPPRRRKPSRGREAYEAQRAGSGGSDAQRAALGEG
jgi:tRNA (adenine57-N1/adenine58-N1)-methyltransferase